MGKLKKISFAGVDDRTDLNWLRCLQEEYPMVEYGILLSLHWYENGNRYFSPYNLPRLRDFDFNNLCAHFCGQMAKDAVNDDWRIFEALAGPCKNMFKRAQINIAPYNLVPYSLAFGWWRLHFEELFDSIIVQQKPSDTNYFERIKRGNDKVDVLIDGSGGSGLEVDFKPYPHKFVGYAGGINPDNVVEKVKMLVGNPGVGDFWIDMESGVRNEENYFDVEKVEKVLENLKNAKLL